MHLEIKKVGKDTVLVGDEQFFRYLSMAANNAGNGFEENHAEATKGGGRLILQPLTPAVDQLPRSKTAHAQARA